MPTTRERPRRALWAGFLDDLAKHLGNAIVTGRHRGVAWRDGDSLNRLGLIAMAWPDLRFPHAPRITRMTLNVHSLDLSAAAVRRLGFTRGADPGATPELRLEWTVLGDELLDFADWLPAWIRGRVDPSIAIPLPPHPSHVWGQGLRHTDYAWTATAFNAHAYFNEHEPWLQPYAIPASEVTPALAVTARDRG